MFSQVNKVLQFRRARIKVRQVVWPGMFLISVATAILIALTVSGDYTWERTEIDDVSGETLGRCQGDSSLAFLLSLAIICFMSTVLTGVMAYKTSDVDDTYSESKYIFSLILVQLQVSQHHTLFVGELTTACTCCDIQGS